MVWSRDQNLCGRCLADLTVEKEPDVQQRTPISILFPTAVGRCCEGKYSGGKSRAHLGNWKEAVRPEHRERVGECWLDEQKRFSPLFLFLPWHGHRHLTRDLAHLETQQARLQTGWAWHWGRGTSHVAFNSCSFLLPLVFEALRVCKLVRKASLKTIKILKAHMNGLLFICLPFIYSSLIFLLLIVLKKYLKIECSREHRA